MHPDMQKMMGLQALDLEAKRLRDEIAALPKQVAALDGKAKATAGQRAVVLDLIAKEDAARRRHESDIEDLKAKAARGRAKLDAATNTVQVTALEHELEFNRKEIARLEDLELESMVRGEELDAQKKIADAALVDAEAAHKDGRARAIATLDRNNAALADLDPRRGLQRATIGEAALGIYDRIARNKGSAVSEAKAGKCSACQMMLRPQRWNDLRERDLTEIIHCESCGRMLFYDPAMDAPQRKPAESATPERKESIAAQIVRGL